MWRIVMDDRHFEGYTPDGQAINTSLHYPFFFCTCAVHCANHCESAHCSGWRTCLKEYRARHWERKGKPCLGSTPWSAQAAPASQARSST